jgi:MFS family permease
MVSITVSLPLAGAAITALGGYPRGYQVMFALMALSGVAGAAVFRGIPEPAQEHPAESEPGPRWRVTWWRGPFGAFLAGVLGWAFFNAIAAPFYVVRMSQDLGMDATAIGMLGSFSSVAQTIAYPLLGRSIDRRGSRGAIIASLAALSLVPAGWLLVSHPLHILPIYLLAAFGNAGYGLASLNLLLELSPEEGRAGYTSAYYSLAAVASAAAPLAGGWIYSQWAFNGAALVAALGGLLAVASFARSLLRPGSRACLAERGVGGGSGLS